MSASFWQRYLRVLLAALGASLLNPPVANATYPVVRAARKTPEQSSGAYVIHRDRPQQQVWGLGFEIQCDSIASGNKGLPKSTTSVPHDLVPAERERFCKEMLTGFRYCRLAGGLYWRGTDSEGKYLRPRWPAQLVEIREMIDKSGIEGVSLEYWSPAPFWKANRKYTGGDKSENTLRCFGKAFDKDPVYQGDIDRFLTDFAAAFVRDIQTLKAAGIGVSMWGLSNEPWVDTQYSSCKYSIPQYGRAFKAVAPAVRAEDPKIKIIADTNWGSPKFIAPVMKEKAYAKYVDALVVHAIGDDSRKVPENFKRTRKLIKQELPLFQNEYEYLQGPASPARCVNTVQNIMNWFQLAESPTWFWIHALKPFKNTEASGYSLGFWMPTDPDYAKHHLVDDRGGAAAVGPRNSDRHQLNSVPEQLMGAFYVTVNRGKGKKPAPAYSFNIDKRCAVYLAVHDRGKPTIPDGWKKTDLRLRWKNKYTDTVYHRVFEPGQVDIPGHDGRSNNGFYGVPNLALIQDISGETTVVRVSALPTDLGGKTGVVQQPDQGETLAKLQPGHWTWNKYNWHSVVGFLKHMPWDSTVVKIEEAKLSHDARILAFKRPDGKLVLVLSNRTFAPYTFKIRHGLDTTFKGYRYTPEEAGPEFKGVEIGSQRGSAFEITLEDLTWEFWVEQ